MAAKDPACGRAGLTNNRSPVGTPRDAKAGSGVSPAGPGERRRGGPGTPTPPGAPPRDAPVPAPVPPPPLTCTRASVRSSLIASSSLGETYTPLSARGTLSRPQPAARRPRRQTGPKPRCPGRKGGSGAGRQADTGCRRSQPGSGAPSWPPGRTPWFWHPRRSPNAAGPQRDGGARTGGGKERDGTHGQPSRRGVPLAWPQRGHTGTRQGAADPLGSPAPERGALPAQPGPSASPVGPGKPQRKSQSRKTTDQKSAVRWCPRPDSRSRGRGEPRGEPRG